MISGIMKVTAVLILAVVLVSGTSVVALAGAVGGERYGVYRLPGAMIDSMQVDFWGGETAEVGVIGDGFSNLDLYVYDSQGNLVAWDEGATDLCYVKWLPRYRGFYTIKVVNRGSTYSQYKIITN